MVYALTAQRAKDLTPGNKLQAAQYQANAIKSIMEKLYLIPKTSSALQTSNSRDTLRRQAVSDQLKASDKGRKAPDGKGKRLKSGAFSFPLTQPGAGQPSTAALSESCGRFKVQGCRQRLSK